MAKVRMDAPPALPSEAAYGEYMPWLLRNFFYRTCAYCLARHWVLAVDHFEPRHYAPARVNDPTNLLPACGNCNGRGGKGDYHPAHAARTRLSHDGTGHMPIDVRSENLGDLYSVEDNGRLSVARSRDPGRATWNATTLLKLDRPALDSFRARLIEKKIVCESLLSNSNIPEAEREPVLAPLLRDLTESWLFFHAFDIPVAPHLRDRILMMRKSFQAKL